MKIFVLILFVLALGAHFLIQVSESKRRNLYKQNRFLDHMPENSGLRKKKKFWFRVGNWSCVIRDVFVIAGVIFILLIIFKII
ncbi:MAG: hypothetical protein Athens071416_81 [Parcubacteria group bacterium Athens0714_16]|nr:MAG: hypothetical protein Athens071416_81 [Parcubacteria group bacterium Athens0714_16]